MVDVTGTSNHNIFVKQNVKLEQLRRKHTLFLELSLMIRLATVYSIVKQYII